MHLMNMVFTVLVFRTELVPPMNSDFRWIYFPSDAGQPHPHPTSRSSRLGEKRVSGREGSWGRSPKIPEHEPRPCDSRGCLRRRSLFPRALSLPPQESWSQRPGSQSEPVHRRVRTSDSFLRPPQARLALRRPHYSLEVSGSLVVKGCCRVHKIWNFEISFTLTSV